MKPVSGNRRFLLFTHTILGAFILLLLLFATISANAATRTVTSLTDSGTGSLRQVIADAASGDTIVFGVAGTITLTNGQLVVSKNLSILGADASAQIISGNHRTRVIHMNANVNLTLSSVTIARGLAENGAGIYNAGGTLALHNCTLSGNSAVGGAAGYYSGNAGTNAYGGAVYNTGIATAISCTFVSNSANGGGGGSAAWPTETAATGGSGNGGAFANFGILTVKGCLLASNSAAGGTGGDGGAGFYGCPGETGGPGGDGGFANGGALFNAGVAEFVNNTFGFNVATGGKGGYGGSGGPPMWQSCSSGCGGYGGMGGSGFSAIYDATGQCYFTNCTVASNVATPGGGGTGGPAGSWPYPYPPNVGSPGGNGSSGAPGSAVQTMGAHFVNTLMADNHPTNCIGTIVDDGHNLSSDTSCSLTNVGSMTNVEAGLGSLADNGGSTLTMELLQFSPAIESGGGPAFPPIDQRGTARPQGRVPDIGAYEYEFTRPQIVSTQCESESRFRFQTCGLPNCSYTVQTSTNLTDWTDLTNVCANATGVFDFTGGDTRNMPEQFYRLKMLTQ